MNPLGIGLLGIAAILNEEEKNPHPCPLPEYMEREKVPIALCNLRCAGEAASVFSLSMYSGRGSG
jgi:hypothetical protein